MGAPFSEWFGTLGAGRGTAVAVVAQLRATLPGVAALVAPAERRLPDWRMDDRAVVRFYRAVLDELWRTEMPLDQIASVLGLARVELARLFGVRRQALDQWEQRGIPSDRQQKLATVGEIADLPAAKLKRHRIPGVARRVGSAYGERSMLDAIAEGDEDVVLDKLRDALSWAAAA